MAGMPESFFLSIDKKLQKKYKKEMEMQTPAKEEVGIGCAMWCLGPGERWEGTRSCGDQKSGQRGKYNEPRMHFKCVCVWGRRGVSFVWGLFSIKKPIILGSERLLVEADFSPRKAQVRQLKSTRRRENSCCLKSGFLTTTKGSKGNQRQCLLHLLNLV